MAMRRRENGRALIVLVAIVLAICALAATAVLLRDVSRRMASAMDVGVPMAVEAGGPFAQEWSVRGQPVISELALTPGRPGEFLALGNDEIRHFDRFGKRRGGFDTPPKSRRIATDPSGALPHVLVISAKTKWTGAIDHVVTTDYFLHALDLSGRAAWTKRFDPKEASALEALVATSKGRPVVVLSTGRRILSFDSAGTQLWDLPFWHHPGTVTPARGDGTGMLLAARAPRKEVVRINRDGTIDGPWGMGDGPARLRVIMTAGRSAGLSVRQVFGRGQGVRHAVAFFDASGTAVREVELPPDSSLPSYWPVLDMDVDGSGHRRWVLVLSDGTVLVFSASGQEMARQHLGSRVRAALAVPLQAGPDLLVTATSRGLSAWRPVPGGIRPRND